MHNLQAHSELISICGPKRTLLRYLDRVAYASDASLYRLIPQAVLQPQNPAEIKAIFRWSQHHQIPITLRTAGTSLSGQAITDGLLVDLSKYWRGLEVRDQGQLIWLQPGVIGAHANVVLQSYQRKIGPDPASIQACMMGGILANNASGMCCGVKNNAYHSLESVAFILPNGKSFDTSDQSDYQRFEQDCPELSQGLSKLRQTILNSPELGQKIRQKYRQKNTTGYSLNALIDFEHPLDIMAHLLIGSEGTLAMISSAVLKTLPDKAYKHTGLLLFESTQIACEQIQALTESGAEAIELIDQASLKALPPESLKPWLESIPSGICALLIEYQSEAPDQQEHFSQILAALNLPLMIPGKLTSDPEQQALLWKLRKGLYPSIGAARQSGSTVIIEDVVFPVDQLAEGVAELQALFGKHGYDQAIIFGHAKDGNLHFVISQSFNTQDEIQRYDAFMQDVVTCVLKHDGALKAEHGTGRNMAPFVQAEWGPEAYAIMQELKALCDPHNLLNPGVILNSDPQAHLKALKDLPGIDAEVDRCTECGFCEPACPSRKVTLTPRQRIVLRREMQRLQANNQQALLQELQADYQYSGIETCAADSLCSLACPIGIDTGALVKRLRSETISEQAQQTATQISKHFQTLETGLKWGLQAAHWTDQILGKSLIPYGLKAAQKLTGQILPQWHSQLPPRNQAQLPTNHKTQAPYVYFPSCLTRTMGYDQQRDLPHVFMQLAQRAQVDVYLPQAASGLCCGLPFSSKGYHQAGTAKARETLDQFMSWSQQGRKPIVMDTSPCTQYIKQVQSQFEAYQSLQILDAVEFFDKHTHLPLWQRHKHTVVHPVCSLRKMGLENSLLRLAKSCSQQVTVPLGAGCCGYAGDRGLLYPELPAAALADEKAAIQELDADRFCASSRSCEMGLSIELERPFVSILHLLAEALEPIG